MLIARFITHLLTNSDKFKLRYLELRQFKVINDKAADYDYYLNRNLIRDQRKKTFFVNIPKNICLVESIEVYFQNNKLV